MRSRLARLFEGGTVAGGVLLLAATAVTATDVTSRWLLGQPLYFAIEFTALAVGLGVLLAFPARFLDKGNVAAELISTLLSKRLARSVELVSVVISALLMAYVAYVIVRQAIEKLGLHERTPDMALPTGPLWTIAAVVFVLSALGAAVAVFDFSNDDERGT